MGRATTIFATFVLALWLLPAVAAASATPAIEYSTPSPIDNKEATLRFSVNPEGLETSYEVEIARVGQSLKSSGMPGTVPAGEDPVALTVKVPRYFEGALTPGTEYHWRVTAWNDEGTTGGSEQLFTTTDGPTPVFTTGSASQTGSNAVSFTGTVNPEGAPLTDCSFRWVDKTTFTNAGFEKWAAVEMIRFGKTVPCGESAGEIGSGTEPVPISGEATGLEPGEYVFRVEGQNAFGEFVSGKGIPFTISTSRGAESPPALGPLGSLPQPPATLGKSQAAKPCPRAHRTKAHSKRANSKKHRHAKKSKRGKACGLR